ncbi:NYN domain-containing protein, partial [Lactobacillus casei]|nr:NYN domain-containing protein [Lacticaseibacillus casei]
EVQRSDREFNHDTANYAAHLARRNSPWNNDQLFLLDKMRRHLERRPKPKE